MTVTPVRFGVDAACVAPSPSLLRGELGLVTNDAARTALNIQQTSRVALLQAGVRIKKLFSPEHGLQASAADGASVPDSYDPQTGLPILSLYGTNMRPLESHLDGLDGLVFDLPDIGARFYTYIWTLHAVLQSCAHTGKRLIVLDRPNPIGGESTAVEGPLLDVENCGSFLGRAAIPVRHSLTAGELAELWNAEHPVKTELQVIPCSGWQRSMHWPDLGVEFVPTSPAMTSYDSALLYPGTCLFEATNLSVGRGTSAPFTMIGAPWLEATRIVNSLKLPDSIRATAGEAVPTEGPWAGRLCQMVLLQVIQPKALRPVSFGLLLLHAVMREQPNQFRWNNYPTAANPTGQNHFERLIGRLGVDDHLRAAAHVADYIAHLTAPPPNWWTSVASHLKYPVDA